MKNLVNRRYFNALLAQLSIGAYAAPKARPLFSEEITQDLLRPNITAESLLET